MDACLVADWFVDWFADTLFLNWEYHKAANSQESNNVCTQIHANLNEQKYEKRFAQVFAKLWSNWDVSSKSALAFHHARYVARHHCHGRTGSDKHETNAMKSELQFRKLPTIGVDTGEWHWWQGLRWMSVYIGIAFDNISKTTDWPRLFAAFARIRIKLHTITSVTTLCVFRIRTARIIVNGQNE